jgi:DNA replication protein DnaC
VNMRQTSCKICEKPILVDYDPSAIDDPIIKRVLEGLWSQVTCGPCAKQAIDEKAQREKEVRASERLEQWREICPLIYQETDPQHAGIDQRAHLRALAHEFKPGKGLVLAGASRTGKTRSAFSILKREFLAGKSVKYVLASEFRLWNAEISQYGLKKWTSAVKRPSILFIDDVGKAITGDGRGDYTESQFWSILETRFSHGLPVLLTVQQTGEQMRERMSGETGTAFIERIREFCDQIGFKKEEKC